MPAPYSSEKKQIFVMPSGEEYALFDTFNCKFLVILEWNDKDWMILAKCHSKKGLARFVEKETRYFNNGAYQGAKGIVTVARKSFEYVTDEIDRERI